MKITKLYILYDNGVKYYSKTSIDIPYSIIFYISIKIIENTMHSINNITITDIENNSFLL